MNSKRKIIIVTIIATFLVIVSSLSFFIYSRFQDKKETEEYFSSIESVFYFENTLEEIESKVLEPIDPLEISEREINESNGVTVSLPRYDQLYSSLLSIDSPKIDEISTEINKLIELLETSSEKNNINESNEIIIEELKKVNEYLKNNSDNYDYLNSVSKSFDGKSLRIIQSLLTSQSVENVDSLILDFTEIKKDINTLTPTINLADFHQFLNEDLDATLTFLNYWKSIIIVSTSSNYLESCIFPDPLSFSSPEEYANEIVNNIGKYCSNLSSLTYQAPEIKLIGYNFDKLVNEEAVNEVELSIDKIRNEVMDLRKIKTENEKLSFPYL